MVRCETHDAYICSLDLSTDRLGDHLLPAKSPTAVQPDPAPAT